MSTETSTHHDEVPAEMLAAADAVVRRHLKPTPLVPHRIGDRQVWLKLETLQPTGSFKVRGALAAAAAYGGEQRRLVTASAGNHGLGIAYAATRLSIDATVVVARNASTAKLEALRRYGVRLIEHGQSFDDAEAHALELAAEGATYVSAYDDPHVIAGQGTIVTELDDQLEGDLHIVVPIGGGGLAAGIGLRAANATGGTKVTGVEASASRAVAAAMEHGRVVPVPVGETIADGLAGNIETGARTPGLLRRAGVTVTQASEPAITDAVAELALGAGLVVEGAGAVSLAALIDGAVELDDRPTVLIVSGRNISAATLRACLVARA